MDETLRAHVDATLGLIEELKRRGRRIKATPAVDVIREWQRDCAAAINQLSGGSKAHWLSRAYSGALLVRSPDGGAVVEADPTDIVDRVLHVLEQGAASLSRMEEVAASSGAPPRPRKFEFVHDVELRPVLERAFDDSRDALERGEWGLGLILSCGVIDAVLTDALDHARLRADGAAEGPAHRAGPQVRTGKSALASRVAKRPDVGAGGSFDARIAAAEHAGLIRGGCARLPPVARRYRDLTDADGELRADAAVSERDARLVGQVLRVVMRDLDPGR